MSITKEQRDRAEELAKTKTMQELKIMAETLGPIMDYLYRERMAITLALVDIAKNEDVEERSAAGA